MGVGRGGGKGGVRLMKGKVMGKEGSYSLGSMVDGGREDDLEEVLGKLGVRWGLDWDGSNVYGVVRKGYGGGERRRWGGG